MIIKSKTSGQFNGTIRLIRVNLTKPMMNLDGEKMYFYVLYIKIFLGKNVKK